MSSSSSKNKKKYIPPHMRGDYPPGFIIPSPETTSSIYDKNEIINIINTVAVAMSSNPPPQPSTSTLTFHRRAHNRGNWDYDRTIQYNISRRDRPAIVVRVHVHYDMQAHVSIAGKAWIEDIFQYEFPTPRWILSKYEKLPSPADRADAITSYNRSSKRRRSNLPTQTVVI